MLKQAQAVFEPYRQSESEAEGDTIRGGTKDADQATLRVIDKNLARSAELQTDVELAAR